MTGEYSKSTGKGERGESALLFGFKVSGFLVSGFKVSWFHGFIQIGVGVAIGIGIDYLTTNTRDSTARVFIHRFTQITQIFLGIARFFLERQGEFLIFMKFQGFRVSSKSGSGSESESGSGTSTRDPRHSTRDDRQGRPRSGKSCQFILKRAVEPSTLFGFRVSGFKVSRFHPNRGRDRYRNRDRYSLTA